MPKSPRISLRLPQEMIDALTARAAKQGESLGEHVRGVLARSLKIAAPEMVGSLAGADEETRRRVSSAGVQKRSEKRAEAKASGRPKKSHKKGD